MALRMKTGASAVAVVVVCILAFFHTAEAAAPCTCEKDKSDGNKESALRLKIAAIFSILFAGGVGVLAPIVGKSVPSLRPGAGLFFVVKAFAAGVILATGFVHILPDAFEKLTCSCLPKDPWQAFPFGGFGAMVGAMGTLLVDCFATTYFGRSGSLTAVLEKADVEQNGGGGDCGQAAHATHGHARSLVQPSGDDRDPEIARSRVISQVLELGIVVHSVIIGIALGTSDSPSAVRPLVAALSFHQFFEGLGLGGCIAQAWFPLKSIVMMASFFSLTTPAGIAIGIGIASVYDENSPTALAVEGLLDSVAAGILVYMSLVDLLAADFMNKRVQNDRKMQIAVHLSLLLGAGLMSLIAKWA